MIDYRQKLSELRQTGSLRRLPDIAHDDIYIECDGRRMLNFSSNDYLGLASRSDLRNEFLERIKDSDIPLSSSSSRLLTGNFKEYACFEELLSRTFGREAALVFNSGYHANTGILPALADKQTLIIADKLVHASIIDGILLGKAEYKRFRHNDYGQLEKIVSEESSRFEQLIIVTESVFSMDGDIADLQRLVSLKKTYKNILLYVDEAHAIGVRGASGLGLAEELGCIQDVDLLVGTFGKALASMGAYLLCSRAVKEYLVNTMRPLIFSTALPPLQIAWTQFVFERLPEFTAEREHLSAISRLLRVALNGQGGEISDSHIIPYIVGENQPCVEEALRLQREGFYCLPVRPPTVPKGTARIRFSLNAAISEKDMVALIQALNYGNNEIY